MFLTQHPNSSLKIFLPFAPVSDVNLGFVNHTIHLPRNFILNTTYPTTEEASIFQEKSPRIILARSRITLIHGSNVIQRGEQEVFIVISWQIMEQIRPRVEWRRSRDSRRIDLRVVRSRLLYNRPLLHDVDPPAGLATYLEPRSRLRPRYRPVSRVHLLRARASAHWSRRIAALRKGPRNFCSINTVNHSPPTLHPLHSIHVQSDVHASEQNSWAKSALFESFGSAARRFHFVSFRGEKYLDG